jgi:hypothetical protein
VGSAVYDWVAARRQRDHCTDGVCAPGTARELPRLQRLPARTAVAGLAVWALVSAVVAEQVVASDRRFEREPLISDYPMYAWTFDSTAAFDLSRERKLSRYRLEMPTRENVTSKLVAVAGDEYVLDLAYALRAGQEPSPDLLERIREIRATYVRSYGTELEDVVIRIDRRSFDWDAGRFAWKERDALLARVDLATASLEEL